MRFGALLARRCALALATLWLLSVLVFAGGQLLPGDVARAILGPLADSHAVATLDHQLGIDRPLLIQYWRWISSFVTGDMGDSYVYHAPVAPMLGRALEASLKLGTVAFALTEPISITAGIWCGLHAGRILDRLVSAAGLLAASLPEFVSGILLILIFGIWLKAFPVAASWPPGAGALTQLHHLVLPSLPLALVLFGYLARMTRAGTIEALASDYTRTAVLKGLHPARILWHHVLRNALPPTVTVIATQTGYLLGGLVIVETLFRYPGIGSLIYTAARDKDFPMLEAGVLLVGIIYTLAGLAAEIVNAWLDPRVLAGASE